MNDRAARGIARGAAQSVARFHDVVVEHLIGHHWKHGRDVGRRFLKDHVGPRVDRNEGAGCRSRYAQGNERPTARKLESAAGEEVRIRRAGADGDFDLDGWHGIFSFLNFVKPFARSMYVPL